MADDPKLIEAVARAIDPWATDGESRRAALEMARDILAAINASGTHWVAPTIVTEAMYDAGTEAEEDMQRTGHGQGVTTVYGAMRTAYLAKTETGK